ncbi:tRNA (adenosine(37)-N6)-dimethylallyltransferase MiaA [Patescibacteria group bacterium]|nr:tRNA (adenosine(37)-N6)-dimethylallyltransferase MiaA [Patescibacteria group bacterium]
MIKKVNLAKKPWLLVITGPTASGKTDLALLLAKKYHGCIISADSRQIYQQAQIGTNQPTGHWQKTNKQWRKNLGIKKVYSVNGIPHFFIDELKPNKTYSVVKFQNQTNQLIHKLSTNSYLPIMVGGTGLYLSAITQGYLFPQAKPNKALQKKLNKLNLKQLLIQLKKADPKTYAIIDKQNPRRLVRALEYVLTTGQSFNKNQQSESRPNTLILGINLNNSKLSSKIKKRTKQMLRQGLIKETTFLLKNYPNSVLLKTIGYKETTQLIKQQINLKETSDLINLHTKQYAKRQMTWFKKMPGITWITSARQAKKIITKNLSL